MMRPRTPTFLWIPFVFSIGGFSWALLIASLTLLSALIIAPAITEVKAAEAVRNDVQATVDLLDQQIALQKEFLRIANSDQLVMLRLASRSLHLERRDQQILTVNPNAPRQDRSVTTLLAESLAPVDPKPVAPVGWYLEPALSPHLRPMLMVLACGGLFLSFILGVRFERR